MTYIKPNDSSRKGDMAEYYAVTWLWIMVMKYLEIVGVLVQ